MGEKAKRIKKRHKTFKNKIGDSHNESECRYCHDTIDLNDSTVFRPCLCKSSIHKKCLEEIFIK